MTAKLVEEQLAALIGPEFTWKLEDLTERWIGAEAGLDYVEPILRFMEHHSELDYGSPGALVHFVERFYKAGYEDKLLQSIRRLPTPHTIWMLNRLINGTSADAQREALRAEMRRAAEHPSATSQVRDAVLEFMSD
jgi:hypothetical protein